MKKYSEATRFSDRWKKNYQKSKYLYAMLLPLLLYYFIFHYIPMAGAIIINQPWVS